MISTKLSCLSKQCPCLKGHPNDERTNSLKEGMP